MSIVPSHDRFLKVWGAVAISCMLTLNTRFTGAVPAQALVQNSILVNTLVDENNQDGDCSLREAIQAANTNAAVDHCTAGAGELPDSIQFAVMGTVMLGSQLSINAGGPLVIAGGSGITLSGESNVRVFYVNGGAELSLENLSITNGSAENGGGIYNIGTLTMQNVSLTHCVALGNYTGGGGIYNTGTLTMINSSVSSNYVSYHIGGGILNSGVLNIVTSNLVGNGAYHDGGGIYNTGTVTITSSTLKENSANYKGGAILNTGTVSFSASTLSANTALNGGGIYNLSSGTAIFTNSTLSGNNAGSYGGGIHNDGSLTLASSTITANHAGYFGGGIRGSGLGLSLRNSIVASNSSGSYGPDCSLMALHSGGYNLIGKNSDCSFSGSIGDQVGTDSNPLDPHLGPLQNNGGSTLTHALLLGSSAINGGNPGTPGSGGDTCETTDQRGITRSLGGRCDIGAYETGFAMFDDVPNIYWAWSYIERLYAAGITGGCVTTPLKYCPEATVTRAQMAVFLLRGIHGAAYSPPAVGTGTGFSDVPSNHWAAAWIKQLAAEGITGGCGNGKFCPETPVTRDQMAVFLLRSEHGSTYSPPAVGGSTGFGDVPSNHWAAAWIKQLVTEGITAGCGNGNYCPATPVNRAQMAVFLVRTFNLP